MKNRYYRFKGSYIFGENGGLCYIAGENNDIYEETNSRGDGVTTSLQIDLFNGEIRENRYFFESTYIKNVEPIKSVGWISDLVEVTEIEAIKTLKENIPSVSLLIEKHKKDLQKQ